MSGGELIDRVMNPQQIEGRVQKLQDDVGRLWRAVGALTGNTGGTGGSGGRGKGNVAGGGGVLTDIVVPEVARVDVTTLYTAEGIYAPAFSVVLDEGNILPPANLICYVLEVTPSSGETFMVSGPQYPAGCNPVTFSGIPAGSASVRAACLVSEGQGQLGPSFPFSVTADTSVPGVPTGVVLQGKRFNALKVVWDNPLPTVPDYSHSEVYLTDGITDKLVGSFKGLTAVFNYDAGDTAFNQVKVRHVDLSLNVGPFCTALSVLVRLIAATDIAAGAVGAAALNPTINYTGALTISGTLTAGGGKIVLGPGGLTIGAASGSSGLTNIDFYDDANVLFGRLSAQGTSPNASIWLETLSNTSNDQITLRSSKNMSLLTNQPALSTLAIGHGTINATAAQLNLKILNVTQTSTLQGAVETWDLTAHNHLYSPYVLGDAGELKLSMTNDGFGGIDMYLHNRSGENGVVLYANMSSNTTSLLDFIMRYPTPGGDIQRNIRLEGRSGAVFYGAAPEWQFGNPGDPDVVFSANGLSARRGTINAPAYFVGGVAGFNGTVALAKLTTGGTAGSLTFTSGIPTSYTAPT